MPWKAVSIRVAPGGTPPEGCPPADKTFSSRRNDVYVKKVWVAPKNAMNVEMNGAPAAPADAQMEEAAADMAVAAAHAIGQQAQDFVAANPDQNDPAMDELDRLLSGLGIKKETNAPAAAAPAPAASGWFGFAGPGIGGNGKKKNKSRSKKSRSKKTRSKKSRR